MPRRPRNLHQGGIFHLLNRGNDRQEVFHDNEDYQSFLDLLKVSKARYGFRMYAYCLMPNHFHLLIDVENAEILGRMMQWLTTCHVRRYGRRYSRIGRIWQGQFKSGAVTSYEYLHAAIQYIEGNPVRAGLTASAADYPWSSHRANVWGAGIVEIDNPPVSLPPGWTTLVDTHARDDWRGKGFVSSRIENR